MNKLKKLFQMKFSQKELRAGKKIIASIMLPIMIFQMTSMNFLAMELMKANAEEVVAVPVEEKKEEIKEEKKVEEKVEVKTEIKTEEKKVEEKVEIVETKTAPEVVEEKVETEVVVPKEEVKNVDDKKAEVETKTEIKKEEVKKEIGWVVDGTVASMEKVELNKIYKAPQNEKVTVIFTKLPEIAGSLVIKEIKLTNEEKKSLGALGDTAYDITSDMTNGTFEYNLTLPYPDKDNDGKAEILGDSKKEVKAENLTVLYTEGEELKQKEMKDVKSDKADGVEKQANKTGKVLEIKGLDHFTIFVVTAPPVMTDPVCSAYPAVFSCVTSLQTAIDSSIVGGTIMVSGGTYDEATVTVNKNLTFEISDNVVINGNFIINSGSTLTFEGHGKTVEATGAFTNSGMISSMTSTSGNVVLKSGGNFTVGDISAIANISITSTSGNILDDGVQTTTIDAGGAITLSAGAGNIGAVVSPVTAVSNFNNAIDVEAGTGNVQASALGNISVTEASSANVNLSKYILTSNTAGSYVALGNLTAAGNLEINDTMDSDAKIALMALGNIIDSLAYTNSSDEMGIYAKGNVTMNDLLTVSGASGTAIIKAGFDGGTGSILDDGDQTTTITAKNITLDANGGTVSNVTPGAGGVIDFFGAVDVALGGGTLTTSGGYVTETGGVRNGTYILNGGNLSISKNFSGGGHTIFSANGKLKIQDDNTEAIILIGEYAGAVPSALNIATAFGTYYRVQSTGAVNNVNFELRYTVADRGALAESKVSNAYYNDGTWHGYASQTVSNVDFVDTVAYDGKISFSSSTLGTIVAGADETAPIISETTRVATPANDNTPNYTFTTNEAGTISYGGSCSSATTVATVGANTITFSTLSDGLHDDCTITVSDTALNGSNILSVFAFTVDTVGPIFTVNDDVDSGPVKTDTINITVSDATGTVASQFHGFSADGICDVSDTIATAFDSGVNFTILGGHADYLCVKAVDVLGNISYELVGKLNTINPTVTVNNLRTNDTTPALSGTIVNDTTATISVTVNGTPYDATNNTNGTWTLADNTITPALVAGTYEVVVTATDEYANVGSDATSNELVIDLTAPTLTAVNIASNNANSAFAKIGDEVTITFTASEALVADPVSTISGNATVVANTSGNNYTAKYTMQTGDAAGVLTFAIDFTDVAGNTGTQRTTVTDASSVTFDKTAPTAPALNTPADTTETNDTTPTVSWIDVAEDEASYIVEIDNDVAFGSINFTETVVGTIVTSTVTPALSDGTYYWRIKVRDAASNESISAVRSFIIDTTAPTIQSITSTTSTGNYNAGDGINVTVTFSELVTLASGTLNVTLDTGDVIAISAFGPALTATGTYTVGAGDTSADLDSTGIVLNGVATLKDAAGNDATIELPATTIADGVNVIVIDTTAPVIARSVLKADAATIGGFIKQSDTYIIYAQVDDTTSGLNSVVGDFSNITTGENSEAMTTTGGPWTIDTVSYNYSSTQYISEGLLAEGAKAYAINAIDNATNSVMQFDGSAVVDNAVSNDPNVLVYESGSKTLPALTTNKWYNHNTPFVEWPAPSDNLVPNASGISGYYICVDTTNSCNPSAGSLQTATNFTFPALTNGQTYYLRMEVKDNAGNITTTGGGLFIYKYDNEIPNAGTVVDDGAWTNSTNTLHATWATGFSDTVGITSYDYSIGTSAGDTSVKSWTDNLLVTSFTDAGLTLVSGTTYYVNVRAKDEAGNISDVVSSDGIRSDLVAPTGTTASSPTNSSSTFVVSWAGTTDTLSTPNGHYKVKYKDQSTGSWTDWLADTTETTSTFGAGDVPVALISGHTYYFEVAGQDVAGNWEVLAGGAGEDNTIYDTTAPNNPTVTGYQTSGKTNTLPTNNWYNYANPYFEWTTPQDEPSGAGLASVGIEGYYVYFGTDNAADPTVWQTTANYTSAISMTSGLTYYLRVKTKDNLGNISSAVTVFTYKYDIDAPNNPSPVSGWSTSGKVTALTSGQWYNYANPYFDWSAATDNPGTSSGVREYYKYFGTDSGYNPTGNLNANLYYSDTVTTSAIRYLRIKTVDNADLNATGSPVGNISAPVTAFDYRFDNIAPTTVVSAVTPIFDNGTKYVKGDFTATGTATDTGGSGVGRVDVQIKDVTTSEYWNGTAWQGGAIWVTATGTTSWSYATSGLLLTGRSANVITVQSKAYDSVNGGGTNGNSGTSTIYSMTVDIIAPVFGTNNTAATGTTGDSFTFSQNVTEAGSGINGVNGYVKVEYWYGTGAHTIATMSITTGTTFALNVTLPSNSIDALHYIFKTMDNVGNSEVVTGQNDVSISDNDKPSVNVTTENTTATANGTKTIEADVDDNIGVHEVVLHYRNSGGGTFKTTNMSHTSGNHYETTIDVQQSITGKMDYYVTADDAKGNSDTDNNSGSYYKITVVAAALHHFDFIAPSGDQTAGGYFYVAVQAKDEFGNIVASFNGTGNRVAFTTDEAGVSAFVKGTATNLSGLFSGGSWMGEVKFGTGTVPVADNTLILRATKEGGIEYGETTINAVGGGFGTVGSVEGASDGSQVQGDQAPADQGVLDDGVVKDGSPVSFVPWYKSLPFEIIAVLILLGSTIWWWIRRQGANGGIGGFSSFVFIALKAAASRARMFLW
ncbi:MAG: Ig-like domain-containing protein [Candidatus Moraniibacteriota bacterium]